MSAHIVGMPTSDPHAIQRDIAQRFERGISKKDKPVNPRLSTLISLAGAFGTDLGQLLVVEYDSSVTDTAELPGATYPEELPPARP